MNDQKVDLTKGGTALVLTGATGFVKEYASHPQVKFVPFKRETDLNAEAPINTRIVILMDGLGPFASAWASSFARQKNIPYIIRKSNDAVYQALKSCFPNGDEAPVTQEEAAQSRGKLSVLIPLIDFTKSNAENGKILLREAFARNIKTTEGSVTQLVAIQRRKLSGTALPKSARTQLDVSVDALDAGIKALTDVRDYLIATVEENRLLKQKFEQLKKAMS